MSGRSAPAEASPGAPRELTVRALVTGLVIGAVLTPTNVYSGLKIGWSFNLSITALLIAYAVWRPLTRRGTRPAWQLHESNIAQTAASSAASIVSGGLVAPIPAWLLISGDTIALLPLTAWVFSVSFLGVWVAWFLRVPLLAAPRLRFPVGIATAETLRDTFAQGRVAMLRFRAMLASLVLAALTRLADAWWWTLPRFAPTPRLGELTFGLDPSLMMLGFGAIIGPRAGLSLALGALIAWGGLAPWLLASGRVTLPAAAPDGFQALVGWLVWPGVALMVAASLAAIVRLPRGWRHGGWRRLATRGPAAGPAYAGLLVAATLTVALEIALFDIGWLPALLAVPCAFVLAAVAARVVGETGIAPIGAIGKVSQLSFAVIAPAQAVTNLMTANVAGGAAGQCADLLNDLKAGQLVGASPARQVLAQCCGIAIGSLTGSVVFLLMIPAPAAQLLTPDWPAPAVAVWKSVAEALAAGLDSVPPAARSAALIAPLAGVLLGLAERHGALARWLPSGATLGLAFVIPASTAFTLCAGALLAWALLARAPRLAARYLVACAAGLIAGESLFGVFLAIAG
ncbi:MAG: OPT family oligopeptide transporter [Gammaproteobacteria bacterium]